MLTARKSPGRSDHQFLTENTTNCRPSLGTNYTMEDPAPRGANVAVGHGAVLAVVAACAGQVAKFLKQSDSRQALKLRCSERLRVEHGFSTSATSYAEQAALVNLDWGVDGLESAIVSVNADDRAARLEQCQRLLQVPALLDPLATTAGVPNCYLSAWAHLYLALLFKLRDDDKAASVQLLEMFVVDPTHARCDLAPQLWNELFMPHTSCIQAWYMKEHKKLTKARHNSPSSRPTLEEGRQSHSRNKSRATHESSRGQVARMEILDKLYEDALDENTRNYARYYLEWLDAEEASTSCVPMDVPVPPESPLSWSTSDSHTESLAESAQPLGDWRVSNSSAFSMTFQDEDRESSYQDDLIKMISSRETSFKEADADDSTSLESENLPHIHQWNQGHRQMSRWDNLSDAQLAGLETACAVEQGSETKDQSLSCTNSSSVNPPAGSPPPRVPSSASSDSSEQEAIQRHSATVCARENQNISTGTGILSEDLSCSELEELKSRPQRDGALKPPKRFVSPITHELFENPVTLDSGQTYERSAVQEWLDEDGFGNVRTVTVQDKTTMEGGQRNEKQNHSGAKPGDCCPALNATLIYLDSALSELSSTEELSVWEEGVTMIAALWVEWKSEPLVKDFLSNLNLIQRLMHLLSNSTSENVLRTSICLLCDLSEENEFVKKAILETDPELKVLFRILTLGAVPVPQSAILLYLLKGSPMQQGFFEAIPILVNMMDDDTSSWEGAFEVCWKPRAAAIFLLEEMLTMCDNDVHMEVAMKLLHLGAVPALLTILDSHVMEEKISAASILLACIETDGGCGNSVYSGCQISSIIDLLHCNNGKAMKTGVALLMELIRVDRRSFVTRILSNFQRAGHPSTMHALLVHIQDMPLQDRLQAASLLLQIDLVAGLRMNSMFNEEALEVLIEALGWKDNEVVQLQALKALSSLTGRFTNSGECSIQASILKEAGYEHSHSSEGENDKERNLTENEEEKLTLLWERRVANVLFQTGKDLFEALGMALSSSAPEVITCGLGFAAWLSSALKIIPDIGVATVMAERLLPRLINILNSDSRIYNLVLATFCLESYMKHADTREMVVQSSKELIRPLRRLKQLTWCAKELFRSLVSSSALLSHADVWKHTEVDVCDSAGNGEIRALAHGLGHLFSGHSDGSIKVWDLRRYSLLIVQEVKEHSRAVSCIAVSESSNRLVSGSADKSVRIWFVVEGAELKCVQVIDTKEVVQAVACSTNWICIVPQTLGVKLLSDSNAPVKLLNSSKNVQCMVVAGEKLYCGCTDSSLQVVDAEAGQVVALQGGTRTLMGKKPIYAVQVYDEFLYTAGMPMPVDGLPAKVWNREEKSPGASFGSSNVDVRLMSVSEDFIYLGYNSSIEVWLRQTLVRVASIAVGSRVTALATGGDVVYIGCEDGLIRIWCLE